MDVTPFQVGMTFDSLPEARHTLLRHAVDRHESYMVVKSEATRHIAKCRDPLCEYEVRIGTKKGKFRVTVYNPHTCPPSTHNNWKHSRSSKLKPDYIIPDSGNKKRARRDSTVSSEGDAREQNRHRSRQACIQCRSRKVKCDGNNPCRICADSGSDCGYTPIAQSAFARRQALVTSHGVPEGVTAARDDRTEATDGPSTPRGILEPWKQRFVGREASIAFPLFVGLDVQAANPPRLHSFAYNPGVRREPETTVDFEIAEAITWEIARSLIDVYIASIHPLFNFCDHEKLLQRADDHWHGKPQGLSFEAVISGVVALGSLFNAALSEEKELWTVQHAKSILEDSVVGRHPTIEQVAAYILRTIYVRSTSRPHLSWLCSCNMMHLVEATGLQHGPDAFILAPGRAPPDSAQRQPYNPKRTAQVAECLHVLIACDYGRSVMNSSIHARQEDFAATFKTDLTAQLCTLVQAIPVTIPGPGAGSGATEQLSALSKVASIDVEHEFLVLVKADLVFCLYRRLRLINLRLDPQQVDDIITTGAAALEPAQRLVTMKKPWWNVLGTVFQFACVLLALDTPESLAQIPRALETLERISDQLNTHLATEALSTIRQLVRASIDKKRQGIEHLERSLGEGSHGHADDTVIPPAPHDVSFDPYAPPDAIDLDFLLNMNF
ncbi:putative C6 transcription factor [Aspergillus homomorphus CBS 101889]|uniref:Zn(2)-C6 fungal-type domain-containing protein n=1 Tax=Aspergillus homomorphus (strain CBS 101889) TaxID=1450537 RepID=A0A395HT08_ASPHC|nr:hypothetical protein BO97DRAFT_371283 [Aspergillus homomorphus CBS 101889]RAL10920.1 hypothetical protein BO97DRAFT_371283 [Aspergillus homomorphus CBS 101889]